jgi:hypothetical protein
MVTVGCFLGARGLTITQQRGCPPICFRFLFALLVPSCPFEVLEEAEATALHHRLVLNQDRESLTSVSLVDGESQSVLSVAGAQARPVEWTKVT